VPYAEVLPGAVTCETPGLCGRYVVSIQCVALRRCLRQATLNYPEGPHPLEWLVEKQ
jgi:hypothetical protein